MERQIEDYKLNLFLHNKLHHIYVCFFHNLELYIFQY